MTRRWLEEGRCTKYDHLRPSPMPCPPPRVVTQFVVDAGAVDGLVLTYADDGTFDRETWQPPAPLAAGTVLQ